MELYAQGEYQRASLTLRRALLISPNNGEYWAELARIYGKLNNGSKMAEASYYEAMRCQPDDEDYPTELGLIYQKEQNFKKAKSLFETALTINPHQAAAKRALTNLQNTKSKKSVSGFWSILGLA